MTPAEIYRLHLWLRAVKTCQSCGMVKPVAEFGGFGIATCEPCDAAPEAVVKAVVPDELENYWAALKSKALQHAN